MKNGTQTVIDSNPGFIHPGEWIGGAGDVITCISIFGDRGSSG